MKRFFVCLTVFLCVFAQFFCVSNSEEISIDSALNSKYQKMVSSVGFRILNANRIENRIVFYYRGDKRAINAGSYFNDRRIEIYRGLMDFMESEEELAAILSHEISHSVDCYQGAMRGFFCTFKYAFNPQRHELKADKRAVDYMVNAGYDPLAFIVISNKFMSQPRYAWYSTHPLASKRLASVYEYVYTKYPQYLVNNSYKNNIYYQNFLLTSKQNRRKLQNSIETKAKKPPKYL